MPHAVAGGEADIGVAVALAAAVGADVAHRAEVIDDAAAPELDVFDLRRAQAAGEGQLAAVVQALGGEVEQGVAIDGRAQGCQGGGGEGGRQVDGGDAGAEVRVQRADGEGGHGGGLRGWRGRV